jgi:hypothetical protein
MRWSPLCALALLAALLLTALPSHSIAQWFDPCMYHPHALQQLRQRFEVIVGQQFATEAIYAHLQYHLERYEADVTHKHDEHHTMKKPLVLSFHGPTGQPHNSPSASEDICKIFGNSNHGVCDVNERRHWQIADRCVAQ